MKRFKENGINELRKTYMILRGLHMDIISSRNEQVRMCLILLHKNLF